MGIQSDRWIREMCGKHRMIQPFAPSQVRKGVVSYGVSSYGYDMRISNEFKVFSPMEGGLLDPKKVDDRSWKTVKAKSLVMPSHSIVLAKSVEYFRMPRNVLAVCFGKSTYARCGIVVNVTPFEPEWEGYVTIAISNTAPVPVKIYANEGIAQVLFFKGDEPPLVSYADKKGKYQKQRCITLSRV